MFDAKLIISDVLGAKGAHGHHAEQRVRKVLSWLLHDSRLSLDLFEHAMTCLKDNGNPSPILTSCTKLMLARMQPLDAKQMGRMLDWILLEIRDEVDVIEILNSIREHGVSNSNYSKAEVDQLFKSHSLAIREHAYRLFIPPLSSSQVEINGTVLELRKALNQEYFTVGSIPYRNSDFKVYATLFPAKRRCTIESRGVFETVRYAPEFLWLEYSTLKDHRGSRMLNGTKMQDIKASPPAPEPPVEMKVLNENKVVVSSLGKTLNEFLPTVVSAIVESYNLFVDNEWSIYVNTVGIDVSEIPLGETIIYEVPSVHEVHTQIEVGSMGTKFDRPQLHLLENGAPVHVSVRHDALTQITVTSSAIIKLEGPDFPRSAIHFANLYADEKSKIMMSSARPGKSRVGGGLSTYGMQCYRGSNLVSTDLYIHNQRIDCSQWYGKACPQTAVVETDHAGTVRLTMEKHTETYQVQLVCEVLGSGMMLGDDKQSKAPLLDIRVYPNFFVSRIVGVMGQDSICITRPLSWIQESTFRLRVETSPSGQIQLCMKSRPTQKVKILLSEESANPNVLAIHNTHLSLEAWFTNLSCQEACEEVAIPDLGRVELKCNHGYATGEIRSTLMWWAIETGELLGRHHFNDWLKNWIFIGSFLVTCTGDENKLQCYEWPNMHLVPEKSKTLGPGHYHVTMQKADHQLYIVISNRMFVFE